MRLSEVEVRPVSVGVAECSASFWPVSGWGYFCVVAASARGEGRLGGVSEVAFIGGPLMFSGGYKKYSLRWCFLFDGSLRLHDVLG